MAHATLLGNGSRVAVEFAEALADAVPVDDPHVLFASDGAVAVEQALKIAFQYWINRGETGRDRFLALGDAYHGDTIGALSLGDGGFGTSLFDPLRFPVVRTPGYGSPDWATKLVGTLEAHAASLAAVVIEPLVQGASGMLVAEPEDLARVGEACRSLGVLLICDEVATGFGRTGKLFASEWAGPGFHPDLLCLGKGITGGYLPLSATVASGAVFEAFGGPDLGETTFYHGHSYGGNALACAVALRHLQLMDEWRVLEHVVTVAAHLAERLATAVAPLTGVREIRQRGLMVGVELAPPRRAAVGQTGLRWCGRAGRPAPATRRRRGGHASAHHDLRRDRSGGRRARRVDRDGVVRGGRLSRTAGRESFWAAWVEDACRSVEVAGQWRAPRTFDARGPAGLLEDPAGRPGAPGPFGVTDGLPVVSFASNDYLGFSRAPSGGGRREGGSRPMGSGLRRVTARDRVAPGARRARVGTRCLEGMRARGALPDRLCGQPLGALGLWR